ncbi:MAG: hypothetical protein ACI9DJ_001956 [Algoriphagus sp.]
MRSIILRQDPVVSETQKWGMLCFCYKNKIFCFLWTDKKTKEPYILFVEGILLKYPQLEQGSRVRMKAYRVNAREYLQIKIIQLLIREALELYKNDIIEIK